MNPDVPSAGSVARPGRAGAGSASSGANSAGFGKTSYTTRFSYAASDVAGQLLFCWVSFYLLKFYTDVYGIAAGVASTIILVARVVDALDAPVWGIVFEKTNSRWGKSRPWFLWLCGPFAVFGVLTFLTPDLGSNAKMLYAGATYVVLNILYTGINTPVTSILSALTPDPQERVVLTCWRMFGSKLGVLIVNLTAMKMVGLLGGGDERRGFMLAVPLYAASSLGLFLLAFRNLKETVPAENRPQPMLAGFKAMRGNWPWWLIVASSLCFWIAFISRISGALYYFEYKLGRPDLIGVAFAFDFISLGTVFALPWFCRVFSKTTAWALGLGGMIVGQLIMAWGVGQESPLVIVMVGWAFGFLASGAAMAMPFSVLSESVDYGEWKTGVRAPGLLTAIGAAFCLKIGAGIGTALPGWILDLAGYVPKVAQSASALRAMELALVWLPLGFLALALIPALFYGRFEKRESQIQAELAQRRNGR